MGLPGSEGEHRLQERYSTSKRAAEFYNKQFLNHLNQYMRDFIARQEMMFIATSDSKGECDCSFRAGLTGFVHVLNEKSLLYPEYRGNGVFASLGNIDENAQIGLMFIDFFDSTLGLHVNGKAKIIEERDLLNHPDISTKEIEKEYSDKGINPERWIRVEVEEAYIQCAKHIPLLKKLDKHIHWETDEEVHKGGDYFKLKP